MRRSIQVLLALIVAVVAFEAGRSACPPERRSPRSPEPDWADFRSPALVTCYGGSSTPAPSTPQRYALTPYRLSIDGNRKFDAPGGAKDADVWQINLAND